NRIHGGRVDTFTSADGLPDDFIRSLMTDKDGSLWIGTRRGLAHWVIGSGAQPAPQMQTYTHANGLGSDLVGAMARDASGDLWVATLAGLSRLHNNTISNFTTANGLSSNVVTALLPRSDGTLLIGTQDHGWNEWDGHTFKAAAGNGAAANEIAQTTIHAILDDGNGHLWFATGNGIARCDCNAMRNANPGEMCSHWMEFGTADGLHSRETATNSHPSAWRARDGRLWFATPKGLVEVDPAHFPVNTIPPEVALERFAVDDVSQPLRGPGSGLRVSAGHVHFEFDYAGLSYVAPQKVHYRFMLEGFDRAWTEAGTRRAAYYTNIPPGKYTFRVQAANNDGVWNTTGTALSFELRPHFYQTLWFYLLLTALTAAIIVVFLRGRLRRAQREFQVVLGERSRIAREIHDTLAQGYAGVSVQLEVLAELLRQHKVDAAAGQLDKARDTVRHGLADARQSIWALRTQDAGETTLPVKLRRVAEAAEGNGLTAEFSLFGAYRPLPPETEKEIARVAQEAIHNVKKHAGATRVSVQLEYGTETISLEVRDDGRGGASERTPSPARGHFGMTGMKERAAAIGGTLEVESAPGEGTIVRLKAPARSETREQRSQG
ncbi:MAG: sensor histidine kinase, partial [Terracidiphilus sp.]